MERSSPIDRRTCLHLLLQATLAAGAAMPSFAHNTSYRDLLDKAVRAMEEGKHQDALAPLKAALLQDRTEAAGLIALGTLYLHTGSPTRAAQEFRRVVQTFPEDPLTEWGLLLSRLPRAIAPSGDALPFPDTAGKSGPAVSESLLFPLQQYLLLMQGNAASVQQTMETVTPDEKNLLHLEIAGMAALESGDGDRGEALLRALVGRPEMRSFTEDRALLFSFQSDSPMQAGVPSLSSAILLPQPCSRRTVSGRVSLLPPSPLPNGVAFVTYDVHGGGGFTATTNNPPFTAEWDSARYPNGLYTIRAVACDASGRELLATEQAVSTANRTALVSQSLTPEERQAFRERLLSLLTPRPSRKAAHFALAERAIQRGSASEARTHLENVVAIDPLYRNARTLLRQYSPTVPGGRKAVWRAQTTEKRIALTFDDGPHPIHTLALLDALQASETPATFFVVGSRAEAFPEVITRMYGEGHELANHSYSHINLTFLSRPKLEQELCRTSCIVREATGVRPRFYRPPGGNVNSQVSDVAEMLGMAGAFWTVDGLKYEQKPFTAKHLADYVLRNLRPGAIILLHNAPENTIAAIPDIVRGLKERGYTPVTLTDLVTRL